MAAEDDLVAFARFVQNRNPHTFELFCATTEDQFIESVEAALVSALDTLESARKEFCELGERALSKKLSDELMAACIPCTAEEYNNGHVDLLIRHPRGKPFRYLSECKIWDGPEYHIKGMKQLLVLYSSGRHRRCCCIEFVKIANAIEKLRELRRHLDKELPLDQQGPAVSHSTINHGFVTRHVHGSGADAEVLHIACNLYQP